MSYVPRKDRLENAVVAKLDGPDPVQIEPACLEDVISALTALGQNKNRVEYKDPQKNQRHAEVSFQVKGSGKKDVATTLTLTVVFIEDDVRWVKGYGNVHGEKRKTWEQSFTLSDHVFQQDCDKHTTKRQLAVAALFAIKRFLSQRNAPPPALSALTAWIATHR